MNILGQPTIEELESQHCDGCNAVLCPGCPLYIHDKQDGHSKEPTLNGRQYHEFPPHLPIGRATRPAMEKEG